MSDSDPSVEFDADGRTVRAVSARRMAEVDRVATDEVGLHLLSMMENAGRALALEARERSPGGPITVFVGSGGNGGGGLVAARHLANAGRRVRVVLDRSREEFEGVPGRQLSVLGATDAVVDPDATMTLALPKTGLEGLDGDLVLADIGIPGGVFARAGVAYVDPFDGADRVPLTPR